MDLGLTWGKLLDPVRIECRGRRWAAPEQPTKLLTLVRLRGRKGVEWRRLVVVGGCVIDRQPDRPGSAPPALCCFRHVDGWRWGLGPGRSSP